MAALTDLSDLIHRQTGGSDGSPENLFFHKVPRVNGIATGNVIAGRAASLWTYDGMPAGGAVPTSGAIPTRTTQGALPFTAPGGSREKWLIGAGITASQGGVFLLYDRLFHIGGLSGTSTADQSVQGDPASPALTRNTGGAGNIVWYEIYGLLGTASRTLTMTYTNQAGTAGRASTINIGAAGFREATRAQRISLAGGDTGVQAVEKVALNTSTGTAGDFGITIANPLAFIPLGAPGVLGWRDYTTGLPGIPAIDPNACLALMFIPSAATAPQVQGAISFVEK